MSQTTFNLEVKRLIKKENHPVFKYIEGKFKKSKHQNFYDFFDDFLFRYGIITFSYSPALDKSKYLPYVNCSQRNIFRLKKGITNLSIKSYSANQCQKILAKYLIEHLKWSNVWDFENWKPELNNEKTD